MSGLVKILIFVMLNKLRCHARFQFSANQIAWSRLFIQIHMLNDKQCRSRSVGFFRSQLIWIYTVCKGRVYADSVEQGLNLTFTTLWMNSADDNLMIFFFFFNQKTGFFLIQQMMILWYFSYFSQKTGFFLFLSENRLWYFIQIIVSVGVSLHEISKSIHWEK